MSLMNNELLTGLFALGVLVIAGIIAYNKWEERQHRKAAEHLFPQPDEDVLLRRTPGAPTWRNEPPPEIADRREPVFPPHAGAETAAENMAEQISFLEPAAHTPEPLSGAFDGARNHPPPWELAPAHVHANVEAPLPAELLSSGVDAIAVLELVEPAPARQILESQRETLRQLKKPVHWVGFNETLGIWEYLIIESRDVYRRLRVGLQLADRRGPAGSEDFSLFTGAIERLADEFMTVATLPASQKALGQAQQLDKFCMEVDFQIGINLVSCGIPFPGTKIRALAESVGMTLGVNGVYTRYNENGMALFSLQNFEAHGFAAETLKDFSTNALVFLLDVPRVAHGQHVFKLMVNTARRFAETLNGMLVDDNRQPLGEPQLEHICQEFVIKPQVALEEAGIPAGGNLALRLFN
jgi:FtsZ-interacting cell division protein ZipA